MVAICDLENKEREGGLMEDKMLSTEMVTMDGISQKVYFIRGQQVMLDTDLAEIYGYEVKRLNEQVKRNMERFPEDFMFQLTDEEVNGCLRSQIATLNVARGKNIKYNPYAFTEQGIYMLATVLRGELAEQQSIFIMRAFREMRHYIKENHQFVTREEWKRLSVNQAELSVQLAGVIDEQKVMKKSIDILNENFLTKKDFKNFVIYKGQKFEADVAYIDIYQQAKHSIYVIDNYMNAKSLQLLSQKKSKVKVVLFTENGHGAKGFLTEVLVKDFMEQYPTLQIKGNPDCHDRFIILDYGKKTQQVYHCGASSKDAGKKVCAINKIQDVSIVKDIVQKLLEQPDIVI